MTSTTIRLGLVAAISSGAKAAYAAPALAHDALLPGGIQAGKILQLLHFTLGLCAAVFVAILITIVIALLRMRRHDEIRLADLSSLDSQEKGASRGVVFATCISFTLLVGLVLADVMTDRALSELPIDNAVQIEMTGHQWWWEARYTMPNGSTFTVANELHVPSGEPVVISLKTADVIHSFWVPALHGKQDMLPGLISTIKFRADHSGVYRGQCAEFCGAEHALMAFAIVAQPRTQYDAWAASQAADAPPAAEADERRGEAVFLAHCASCHTVRGTSANGEIGPDLTHLMSRGSLAAETLTNVRGNLAGWIVNPQNLKPGTTMPPNPLAAADLQLLLTWLGTLK